MNKPFKLNLLLRQDTHLSACSSYLSSIHRLPSILDIHEVSFFSFTSLLMHSSIHTKNFSVYNSTCVMEKALKLPSVVSQVLNFYKYVARSLGDYAALVVCRCCNLFGIINTWLESDITHYLLEIN